MYVSIIRFNALNFNASFTIDIPGILQLRVEEHLNLSTSAWRPYIDVFSICVFHEKEALLSKTDYSKHIIEVESTALITAVNLFEK